MQHDLIEYLGKHFFKRNYVEYFGSLLHLYHWFYFYLALTSYVPTFLSFILVHAYVKYHVSLRSTMACLSNNYMKSHLVLGNFFRPYVVNVLVRSDKTWQTVCLIHFQRNDKSKTFRKIRLDHANCFIQKSSDSS